jgi:aspartyl/glutamyl-tRNA(Asn/Gln) amidotransferase C subunit
MDRATILWLAELSRLEPDAEECRQLEAELATLLAYFDVLAGVDTSAIDRDPAAPLAAAVLRMDVVEPPLPRAAVLGNAPAVRADAFEVPRMVEG